MQEWMGHRQGLREWGRPTVTAKHRAAALFLPFQSQASSEKTENPPRIFDSSPRIMSAPPHFQEDVQTALFSGTLSTDGTICNSSLLLIHLLQTHQHLLVFLHFSFVIHSWLLFRLQRHGISYVCWDQTRLTAGQCVQMLLSQVLQPQCNGSDDSAHIHFPTVT